MQKISPFLWFDTQAEDAARFYVSVFPDSGIDSISYYGEEGAGPAGTVMVVDFHIFGQKFVALNGGPMFTFNESVSFMVSCETQAEVDSYWSKLTADGGQEVQCGWLKDKYGLSWQITPTLMFELMSKGDDDQRRRVMQAMMGMVKMDCAALQRAFDGA